ncbi:hypothetical protein FNH09_36380 [Streptomyces adustus]|uniref:Uncharacterized protein n=1 Tax=Streptomyces adustus TaxID=1609272 RepID=A0A5N8VNC7_9ACTN|nr:hypothetical protein [Streptomyces adustus]
MGLGQRGGGAGDRPPVPPAAVTAVCAYGRCAEVRHRCPRAGPSSLVARAWCAARACAIAVPVGRAEEFGPASPGGHSQ